MSINLNNGVPGNVSDSAIGVGYIDEKIAASTIKE